MNKYIDILFDMDGTLVDSAAGIIESVLYALNVLGIEEKNPKMLKNFVGPPLKEAFINIYQMDDVEAENAVAIFRGYYAEAGIYNAELYKGINEVLQELQRDYNLYIATSKPTVYTERIAEKLGISKHFKGIVGSNLDNSRSKKAEVIQSILDKYQITDKSKVLMVGDKSQDIIGASQCGIDALGVAYGYGTVEELEREHPVGIIDKPEEILSFMEK